MKSITINKLGKLISESISLLLEREMNNSVDRSFLIKKLKGIGFNVCNENGDGGFTIYTQSDPSQEQFRYLKDLVKRCGWSIINGGNHYGGMRNQYLKIKDGNVGTFIMNLEPNYGEEVSKDYIRNDITDNSKEDRPFKCKDDIFYHITKRKYLPKIMSKGLQPKNGHEITRWRDTNERLYLSTEPDYMSCEDIDIPKDEQDPDDEILLKIDLSGLRNMPKFYEDESYENAVYTTSPIPPYCITPLNASELSKKANIIRRWNGIKKANPNYDAKNLLKYYFNYVCNMMHNYPLTDNCSEDEIMDTLRDYEGIGVDETSFVLEGKDSDVLFTAQNIVDPSALMAKYPTKHPNKFYHHSTNRFGKQSFDDREGTEHDLHITGRLTNDLVDALVVDNPFSDNEIPHITLGTADGIKPYQSNIELQKHRGDIVPLDDIVKTVFRNNLKGKKHRI